MTRRVVMMAFAVSLGSALSASAQTPVRSPLIGLLTQSSRNVTAQPLVNGNVVPVGAPTTGPSTLKVDPLLDNPKLPPAQECGPRPPRVI